jgi:mannitol-1-phosphate 5-dehydrogenase
MLTGNKSLIETKKIVIFGAGKIGRSFIGQLFGRSGYDIIFADVDPLIIKMLNEKASYRVVIKSEKDEEIIVNNVRAISALDKSSVTDAVASAGILAVSVGKNAMEKVIPTIAAGLLKRYNENPESPLDIILAENMRSAAEFTRERLLLSLTPGFPIDTYVGLIETSIGKMVPIIPLAEVEKDPLVVFAEPYNTLILDGRGFKSPIPEVKGLAPKSNIKAWVDRKAFIHNLGHATAAYYGYYSYPGAVYMYEILDDKVIFQFTREVMLQSAEILQKVYPGDFTFSDLVEHIDDLLFRFRNKALQDTIFRVGQDLPRKLGADDRFMGSIHLAHSRKMPCDLIIKAMSYGLFFRATDEEGNPFPADNSFLESLNAGFESSFLNLLKFDPIIDQNIITELKRHFLSLKK